MVVATVATHSLPRAPLPTKMFGVADALPKQVFSSTKSRQFELDFLLSPPDPVTPPRSQRHRTDRDASSVIEPEDEYTLSAYGDVSLGEVIVPPLPTTSTHPGPLQPRHPQPRLRLKVRRPPMPKRQPSYVYVPDPFPYTGGLEHDGRWPGSPRLVANSASWYQHQPLVSPLPVDPTTPRAQGSKPGTTGVPSVEKLVDALLPRSPSIRLSPPGSPACQPSSLPQETRGRKGGILQERNGPETKDVVASLPQSPPAPAPRNEKPWRSRLPPRPPLPKWDV